MSTRITSASLGVILAASALGAQSSREREIERSAERLGRAIEFSIESTIDNLIRPRVSVETRRKIDQSIRTKVDIAVAGADIDGIVAGSIDGAMRALEQSLEGMGRFRDIDWRQGREDRDQDWRQGTSRIDTTFAFSRDGTVDLTSFYGDITVTGWDRNEARVRATSERGAIHGRFSRGRITVEADMTRGRSEANYEVMVPRGVRVVARSMTGDVTVRGTNGFVDAHTNNGDVTVVDAAERIDMGSLSGDITGQNLRGSVEATALSGEVRLTNVEGRSVHVESTSGEITLTAVTSPDIDVSTVSGDVGFSGPLQRGGTYGFQSHSGEVTLRIPANSSARFAIETFNGSLDSDFQVTLQPNRERRSGRRLEFAIGDGEARVVAESFSGTITIRRDNSRR